MVVWGQPKDDVPGVADQPGRHHEQPVPKGAQVRPASSVAAVDAGQFL